MDEKIKKLPKWARDHIGLLKNEIDDLQNLKKLHALLSDKDRDWYTIRPTISTENAFRNGFQLYSLHEGHAQHQVTLYDGDVLYIGTAKRDKKGGV